MMAPFAVIIAILPGPVGTRAMLVAFLLVASAAMGLILSSAFRNRRLVQNGFPPITKPEEDEDERPAAVQPRPAHDRAPATVAAAPAPVSTPPRTVDDDDPDGINA
jgi:hypothetical protein